MRSSVQARESFATLVHLQARVVLKYTEEFTSFCRLYADDVQL